MPEAFCNREVLRTDFCGLIERTPIAELSHARAADKILGESEKKTSMKRIFFIFVLLVSCSFATRAEELRVAGLFSDRAILQRGVPVPVWGKANAGETVSVGFAGQTKSSVAGADGRWKVVLDPLRAGDNGDMVVRASGTLTLRDICVGDVWLCAGDAFMGKSIERVRSMRSELGVRVFPDIRLFRLPVSPAAEPREDAPGQWQRPEAGSIAAFPAVAYEFAKAVQLQTGVPVGIVEAVDPEAVTVQRGGRVTGSTVEAWMSRAILEAMPEAKPIFEYYKSSTELREALLDYENALGDWKLRTGKAFGAELRALESREPDVWYDYLAEMRKAGKPAPTDPPRKPTAESLRMASTRASNLYNGMIAPVAGMALRGVVLNLGLANAPRAAQYRALFSALIADWRRAWGRENLPFVFLQQGRAASGSMDPRAVSELREAQAFVSQAPRTKMVRTTDLPGNFFPEDVPSLAKRMAVAAQSLVDAGKVPGSGPVVDSVRFEGNTAIVRFRDGVGSLAVPGGGSPRGFAVTERPNRWAYAEAVIEGDTVRVSHPKIKAPVAVRYDWVVEAGREGNLFDAQGNPALPYRSDAWPAFTDTPAARKPNAVATLLPADLYPVVDPSLPRVLLIGDSIMNGYSPTVIEALRGKANVVRMVAFGMIGRSDADAAVFCEKLREGDYALIHYNDGLHSLPPRITDEQFGAGLTAMLKHLKTVSPRVLWATTTPAPDRNNTLGSESLNGAVLTRNEMSKKIATGSGVPVVDLYGLIIDQRETLQGFANLHFTPEGSKRMGLHIAERIAASLDKN